MDIVINLPDTDYSVILTKIMLACPGCKVIELPKGHGRLIDADRIVRTAEIGGFGNNRDIDFVLSYIPKCKTIIEADKMESEG